MASHQRGPLVWSSHHSAWHGSKTKHVSIRPTEYEVAKEALNRQGWDIEVGTRSSGNIDNGGYIVPSSTAHGLTTLCFDYTFSYDNETAFFCSSLPYTLTHLRRFLKSVTGSVDSSSSAAGREGSTKAVCTMLPRLVLMGYSRAH